MTTFTERIPSYVIDLDRPEERRWSEVIARDKRAARKLAQEALEVLDELPLVRSALDLGGSAAFGLAYRLSGGRYRGELAAWAKALRMSEAELLLANCSYELSQLGGVVTNMLGGVWDAVMGCTAGVRHVPGLGMAHVRSLDWPLDGMGRATRIFHFRHGEREFVTVGVSGFVGALSGMVPGAYSVTINYAPEVELPTFRFGPAFLLREVLEECDSYEQAVATLRDTPLAAPVFFTVCGARRGQACVIERTPTDAAVRKLRGDVLVQANHHVARRLRDRNEGSQRELDEDDEDDLNAYDWSVLRADTLHEALAAAGRARDIRELARCLDCDEVCNDATGQQMVFLPARGELVAWRRTA